MLLLPNWWIYYWVENKFVIEVFVESMLFKNNISVLESIRLVLEKVWEGESSGNH